MNRTVAVVNDFGSFIRFFISELKPRGKLITPFNVISIPIILCGLGILVVRFIYGLGSVTNLSQETPWGLWLGFDVVTGVALAGGAYVLTFVVYIMKVEKYHSIIRITILNGFLAYAFYGGALIFDIGRPWHAMNPFIGNDFGFASVLFLICWHFMIYMIAAFVEFSPVIAEWLNWEKVKKFLEKLTLVTVILGITLSILHQSGLGALFLMAKPKIHPLWWSEFTPALFFVSSIYAGLSMIIFESTISHKVFHRLIAPDPKYSFEDILFGLAKGATVVIFVYYFLKALMFVHGKQWVLLGDGWGALYLVEVLGFVLVPGFMYAFGFRNRDLKIIKIASAIALIGIIVNRMNVSVVAYNWLEPVRYIPSWQEFVVTAMVICSEIWILRWVVLRMPVLGPRHD